MVTAGVTPDPPVDRAACAVAVTPGVTDEVAPTVGDGEPPLAGLLGAAVGLVFRPCPADRDADGAAPGLRGLHVGVAFGDALAEPSTDGPCDLGPPPW